MSRLRLRVMLDLLVLMISVAFPNGNFVLSFQPNNRHHLIWYDYGESKLFARGNEEPIEGMPPSISEHSDQSIGAVLAHRSTRGKVPISKQASRRNKKAKDIPRRMVLLHDPVLKEKSGAKSHVKETRKKKASLHVATKSVLSQKSSKQDTQIQTKTTTNQTIVSNGLDLPYESAIEVLRVYRSKNSDLVVPRRWVIPENEDYPTEWHGVDLAATVYDMKWWQKYVKQKPDRVAELNKLGFVWERLQPEWNLVLEALITYYTTNGNLLVPNKFVVPHGDKSWPKATWGIRLGICVFRIRNRGDFLRGNNSFSRREQLDALGFVWDLQEHRFQKFYRALKRFSELQGHPEEGRPHYVLRVPWNYVVPSTKEWPEDLWGYKLGATCINVREKELYVKRNRMRQQMLIELGFAVQGNADLRWLEVVHAAAIYSQMNGRKLDVPILFKVPAPPHRVTGCVHGDKSASCVVGSDDAWPWPEYLWGFPLGQRLKDIRLKGAYLSGESGEARRRQLDALGYNWKPKIGRRCTRS